MMFSGKISSSSPKLTYSEASELLDKCNTPDEIIEELLKKQYYPDVARKTELYGHEREIIFELDFNKEDFQDIHSLKLTIYEVKEYSAIETFSCIRSYFLDGFTGDKILNGSEPIDSDLLNRITDGVIK